jgi:hypothetical protein
MQDEDEMTPLEALEEKVHDLEAGMSLMFRNVGELRRGQAEMTSWAEWWGRIHAWLDTCARNFPWR